VVWQSSAQPGEGGVAGAVRHAGRLRCKGKEGDCLACRNVKLLLGGVTV